MGIKFQKAHGAWTLPSAHGRAMSKSTLGFVSLGVINSFNYRLIATWLGSTQVESSVTDKDPYNMKTELLPGLTCWVTGSREPLIRR